MICHTIRTPLSPTQPGDHGTAQKKAVDGDTATCTRTEAIGPNIPDKTVWWKVDLGGVYNIYSVNIKFRNYNGYESRQRGRFAGFSLYISHTEDRDSSSLCFKDGPVLPPLNFTTTCSLYGRYVIFYNERLDGVTYPEGYEVETNIYTELCEVTVKDADNFEYPPLNCKTDLNIAGLSVSVGFNALLIATVVFVLWRYCIKVHPIAFRSCWESELYEKTEHIGGQESTYQELNLKEDTYRNTTLT